MSEVDRLAVDPASVRCYAEGWQSWSRTGWVRGAPPTLEPWEVTMRARPGRPAPEGVTQAEGLLVVDPGDGSPTIAYAADVGRERLDRDGVVPSVRARLEGAELVVTSDAPVTRTEHPGPVPALTAVGNRWHAAAGVGSLRPPPRVWCTWYRYFEQVRAGDVEENLAATDRLDLPVDVVQVDDGWSRGIGEWLSPATGFGDLPRLVDRIRSSGRRAGIWLAPFLVGADTDLARQHPEWLTGDAGHNWGQQLRGLDLTHFGVRAHLHDAVARLAALGIDYFKLDFLYAGALAPDDGVDAGARAVRDYRSGMRLLREAAGPDAYLLGSGAPLVPSLGLVDAMRVSPDTFHEGGEDGSRGLRGRPSLVARAWQQGRLWTNDPDCLVARPGYRLREEWAQTVTTYGGLRSVSDRLDELDEWGLAATRQVLDAPSTAQPFDDALLATTLVEPAGSAG